MVFARDEQLEAELQHDEPQNTQAEQGEVGIPVITEAPQYP